MRDREDDRTGTAFPFLGGLFSSLLLAIALDNPQRRALVWIALMPLFVSLARCGRRPALRAVHAVAFGLPLCAWNLLWYYEAALDAGSTGSLAEHLTAFLVCLASWGTIIFSWAIFALASGPLLLSRWAWWSALGVPLLWCGLESTRAALGSPWVSTALGLGYAFDPATAEGRLATVIGTAGLSALPVLFCTLLTRMLAARSHRGAFLLAGTALLVPVLALAVGAALEAERPERGDQIIIGVVDRDAPTFEGLSGGDLVVWPGLLASDVAGDREALFVASHVAEVTATPLLARVALPNGERGGVLLGPDGMVVEQIEPRDAQRGVVVRLPSRPDVLLGVALDGSPREPSVASRLARDGAHVIIGVSGLAAPPSPRVGQRRTAELAYRTLETGRPVVSCDGAFAFAVSATQPPDIEHNGAVGSRSEVVRIASGWTIYPLVAPFLDVAFTIGALVVLAVLCFANARRGRVAARYVA